MTLLIGTIALLLLGTPPWPTWVAQRAVGRRCVSSLRQVRCCVGTVLRHGVHEPCPRVCFRALERMVAAQYPAALVSLHSGPSPATGCSMAAAVQQTLLAVSRDGMGVSITHLTPHRNAATALRTVVSRRAEGSWTGCFDPSTADFVAASLSFCP